MKKYRINVAYSADIQVDVYANDVTEAYRLAEIKADEIDVLKSDMKLDSLFTIDIESVDDLMNYTNNHNKELVDRINIAYIEKPAEFKEIIELLKTRDYEEVLEHAAEGEKSVDDYTYLMHIADDQDLETILSYLKM